MDVPDFGPQTLLSDLGGGVGSLADAIPEPTDQFLTALAGGTVPAINARNGSGPADSALPEAGLAEFLSSFGGTGSPDPAAPPPQTALADFLSHLGSGGPLAAATGGGTSEEVLGLEKNRTVAGLDPRIPPLTPIPSHRLQRAGLPNPSGDPFPEWMEGPEQRMAYISAMSAGFLPSPFKDAWDAYYLREREQWARSNRLPV